MVAILLNKSQLCIDPLQLMLLINLVLSMHECSNDLKTPSISMTTHMPTEIVKNEGIEANYHNTRLQKRSIDNQTILDMRN